MQVYTFYAGYKEARKKPDPNIKKYSFSDFMKTELDSGYANEHTIEGNDPHNGWTLGHFVVSGFTQRNEDAEHTFLKTAGNQMLLEFHLDQDIYELNGNKNLVISDDANGQDPAFGVPKSKNGFGHGTMLVRFSDYTGHSRTQIYNDFLAANCSPGANTKVKLCEEGDYEVALDYEVHNKAKSSYTNYKIAYNFRVRNGNCMIFAYDNDTNLELANNSVAQSGFNLNLADSHYLNINVKRDVYTQNENGYSLDTRSSKPGIEKDKEIYTDSGIHTITVSNPYTNDTVEKTIYVGTDQVLVAYINPNNNGISVNEIANLVAHGATIDEEGTLLIPDDETQPVQQETTSETQMIETTEESTTASEVVTTTTAATKEDKFPVIPVAACGAGTILLCVVGAGIVRGKCQKKSNGGEEH